MSAAIPLVVRTNTLLPWIYAFFCCYCLWQWRTCSQIAFTEWEYTELAARSPQTQPISPQPKNVVRTEPLSPHRSIDVADLPAPFGKPQVAMLYLFPITRRCVLAGLQSMFMRKNLESPLTPYSNGDVRNDETRKIKFGCCATVAMVLLMSTNFLLVPKTNEYSLWHDFS